MTHRVNVNPGYAHEQLARALASLARHVDPAVRSRAAALAERWWKVVAGLDSGALAVGSRTPVEGLPAWVTLEVVHGGFATGAALAGGPLRPHEAALLDRLGRAGEGRGALNLYYVSDAGLAELREMLASGRYRVDVPEEGALLVVAWLMGQGQVDRATALLDRLLPFFADLRFFPGAEERPPLAGATVRLESAADTRARLAAVTVPPAIAAMNEALAVWVPLTDRFVALLLETVRGDRPTVGPGGAITGGDPCADYPGGWAGRAAALLAEFTALRERHRLCGKPDDPAENLARLRRYVTTIVREPAALTPGDVGAIRRILALHVRRHGAPDSPERRARLAEMAAVAGRPTHADIAAVVARRLAGAPRDAGIGDLDEAAAPVRAGESATVPAGVDVPETLRRKLARGLEAPVDELVARGVIRSSEGLAQVLPQVSAQVAAAAFDAPELRRLYAALYAAFRRRRSLLLVNLERQVRFDELPWVDELLALRRPGEDARARARGALEQIAALAIAAFPQTILPNRLVSELRALADAAALKLPLVEEIAADIFSGAFTEKFLRAAQIAGAQLRGTVYERYYGVPYARVLRLDDLNLKWGARTSPGFAKICRQLAGVEDDMLGRPALNGMVIEQAQILTTHNLAALFVGLELDARLRERLPELAERCFRAACRWQRSPPKEWRAAIQRIKNTAYALRQMIFFLAVAGDAEAARFLAWARRHVGEQTVEFQRRFAPALGGLEWAIEGGELDADGLVPGGPALGRRVLGWSAAPHWLRVP